MDDQKVVSINSPWTVNLVGLRRNYTHPFVVTAQQTSSG
jgi:hypothetical protein